MPQHPLLLFCLLWLGVSPVAAQTGPRALSIADVESLLGVRNVVRNAVWEMIEERCVSFRLDAAGTTRLRRAGADDRTIAVVRGACFDDSGALTAAEQQRNRQRQEQEQRSARERQERERQEQRRAAQARLLQIEPEIAHHERWEAIHDAFGFTQALVGGVGAVGGALASYMYLTMDDSEEELLWSVGITGVSVLLFLNGLRHGDLSNDHAQKAYNLRQERRRLQSLTTTYVPSERGFRVTVTYHF